MKIQRYQKNSVDLACQTLNNSGFLSDSHGKKAIKYSDFHELQDKIEIIGDFFEPGTNTFMNFEDFRRRYETEISDDKLMNI